MLDPTHIMAAKPEEGAFRPEIQTLTTHETIRK